MTDVSETLARLIAAHGPIPVARYMAEANAHYYATRDPLGAEGDFTTAPEISQMFGELVGLWLADLWQRAGAPANAVYVELGPGRGTLAVDALRAMRAAGLQPPVHLVETSPTLRTAQAERIASPRFHDDLATLPTNAPLLVVANEFFDALPIHQWLHTPGGWRELMVGHDGARFVAAPGGAQLPDASVPAHLRDAAEGAVLETAPAATAIMADLAARIATQGGAALIVDYGHPCTGLGDTLQAVASHEYADPFDAPGTRDLTAHVDFEALGDAARTAGARVAGPIDQGAGLTAMGIALRTAALTSAAPHRGEEFVAARDRLTRADAMGTLFKAMAVTAPGWPEPEAMR